jgi:hypothetical protein
MVGLKTSGMSTITPLRVTLPVLVTVKVRLMVVSAGHTHGTYFSTSVSLGGTTEELCNRIGAHVNWKGCGVEKKVAHSMFSTHTSALVQHSPCCWMTRGTAETLMSSMGTLPPRTTTALSGVLYTLGALALSGCADAAGTYTVVKPAVRSCGANSLHL